MRPTTVFSHLALCLGTMSRLTAAWPNWMEEMHLVARQDGGDGGDTGDNTGDNGDGGAADETATTEDPQATGDGDATTRRLNTASTLDPDAPRPTKSGSKGKGNSTEPEEFDVTNPVANFVMVTPAPILGAPLYKAGDFITWEWNYTNLLGTPSAVDVVLKCPKVTATWTLTGNMSFADPATYTWDSKEQQTDATQPLLTEDYELYVFDSDRDEDAQPAPGYLNPTPWGLKIYLPKEYTPLSDWNCATCSAARDGLEQQALGFALSMSFITIATFTWFVAGLRL